MTKHGEYNDGYALIFNMAIENRCFMKDHLSKKCDCP